MIKLDWDWFEEAKWLSISIGICFVLTFLAIYGLVYSDANKYFLIAFVIVSEIYQYIASVWIKKLRKENPK